MGLVPNNISFELAAGDILGLRLEEETAGGHDPLEAGLMQLLIDTRARLRQARQFELADGIREQLGALNVQLEDGPDGTVWRRK